MQRAKHSRFFRLIYSAAPCSNIESGIVIRIRNIATIFTLKAFPFSNTNMVTNITGLRSIGWRNSYQFDAVKAGDWYCIVCRGDRAESGFRYFWNRELSAEPCNCGLDDALAKLDDMMGTVYVPGTITATSSGFDPNTVDTAGMTEVERG